MLDTARESKINYVKLRLEGVTKSPYTTSYEGAFQGGFSDSFEGGEKNKTNLKLTDDYINSELKHVCLL